MLLRVHLKDSDSCLVVCKFKLSGRGAFNRAEDNSAVPVASLDDVVSIFADTDWVVEFLAGSIDLVHTFVSLIVVELLLPV